MPRRSVFHPSLWSPTAQPGLYERVEVDWAHPLAQGLIGCYLPTQIFYGFTTTAPQLIDLSGRGLGLSPQDGASTFVTGPIGLLTSGGNTGSNGGWQNPASTAQRPSFGVSLFTRGYKAGGGTNISSYPMLLGCQWTNSNTAPYDSYDITNGPTDTQVNCAFNVGGTATGANITIAIGNVYNIGMAAQADGVAGHIRMFQNGVVAATGTPGSGSIGYGTTPQLCFNGKVGTGGISNFLQSCGYIWSRMLRDDEMAWLNAEPYAFLRPVRRRRYVDAAVVAAASQVRIMVMA